MAISSQDNFKTFVATGTAAPVLIGFKWAKATDLIVQRLVDGADSADDGPPETMNSSYSIGGSGRSLPNVPPTGFLTEINLIAGRTYRIQRKTAVLQDYQPRMGIAGDASAQENQLDDIVMAQIDARSEVEAFGARALMVPRGETMAVLPAALDRAGKFLAFDTTGDGVAVDGAAPVPALAENITTDGGGNVQQDLDGKVALNETRSHRLIVNETNPEAYGNRVDSVADGKQVDGTFWSAVIQNAGAGYGAHSIVFSDATITYGSAGGMGAAIDGPGWGSADVNNRQGSGPGDGCIATRLGSGSGAGIRGITSSTGDDTFGGYFLKQNPVVGVAGTGPALWALNDSTNGETFRARSAVGNTDAFTVIVDRLNGTQGTASFTRVLGGGVRTALLSGGATHVIPSDASTGAPPVIAHDFQINGNVSGSADVRGINIANAATGGGEAFGAVTIVDGLNTTNYGIFINAANGGTNHNLYLAGAGLLSVGGDIRALNDGTQDIGGAFARFDTIYATNATINTSDAREKNWLGEMSDAHLRAARRIMADMGLFQWLSQIVKKGDKGARVHFGVRAQALIEIFYDEGLEKRPRKGRSPNFRHAFLCYDKWGDVFEPVLVKREIEVEENDWIDTGETHKIQQKPYYVEDRQTKRRRLFRPEPHSVPVMVSTKVKRRVVRHEIDGERVKKAAGDLYGVRFCELHSFLIAALGQLFERQETMIAAMDARLASLEAKS